jgi:hypothetical protein
VLFRSAQPTQTLCYSDTRYHSLNSSMHSCVDCNFCLLHKILNVQCGTHSSHSAASTFDIALLVTQFMCYTVLQCYDALTYASMTRAAVVVMQCARAVNFWDGMRNQIGRMLNTVHLRDRSSCCNATHLDVALQAIRGVVGIEHASIVVYSTMQPPTSTVN